MEIALTNDKVLNIKEFFLDYRSELNRALGSLNVDDLGRAIELLNNAIKNQAQVFVAGNGGSAAIANHLCCDWSKGTEVIAKSNIDPVKPLVSHSLSANTSLLTAIANDLGYEQSYSKQIELLAKTGDVLVLISSSGKSANIVRAMKAAKTKGLNVIGLTGFEGGPLKEGADVALHISSNNYGLIEDAHQAIMHVLAQYLQKTREAMSSR